MTTDCEQVLKELVDQRKDFNKLVNILEKQNAVNEKNSATLATISSLVENQVMKLVNIVADRQVVPVKTFYGLSVFVIALFCVIIFGIPTVRDFLFKNKITEILGNSSAETK